MRLLFMTFANSHTGYGHLFRSLALARTALARGHAVTIAGDRQPADLPWIPARYNFQPDLQMALDTIKPDWLIVDVPDPLPGWIRQTAKCRVCALNGIGYNQAEGLDLRVIQGSKNVRLPGKQDGVPTIKGIEYVILRPELARYKGLPRSNEDVFVWGGGSDVMGLLTRFPIACPGTFATLILGDMTPIYPMAYGPTCTAVRVKADGLEMLEWMAGSQRAVVAMGMCIYELLYLGIPSYVFNSSALHLRFAEPLAEAGLIKLWPGIGLPGDREIKEFVNQPFEMPGETGIDLEGARRVMEAIENF